MSEVLKALQAVYLALLTLCFVSTVFIASIREVPPYAEVAKSIKDLLDGRVYLFTDDTIKTTVDAAIQAVRTDQRKVFADAFQQADIPMPADAIAALNVPTNGVIQPFSETYTLLVLRRSVALFANRHAKVFRAKAIEISSDNASKIRARGLACDVILNSDIDDQSVYLLIRFERKNGRCIAGDSAVKLPVAGKFEDVPATSFREWLVQKQLLKPPLFVEKAPGEITFLDVSADLWSEILAKKPAEAYDYLLAQGMKSRTTVKVFGVEIDQSLVIWLIPSSILALMLVLYLYLGEAIQRAKRRKTPLDADGPWIGNFASPLAQFCYACSILLWPLGLAIGFTIQLWSGSLIFVAAILGWILAAVAAAAAFFSSRQLRAICAPSADT
ncbi:hypothetical protein [Mesorhizobium huakuii]|uniref:MacB-like periplasmic core domain-containing protein n=1 Tax=Mesorhizobium huakuii TaxID=28104 RepID=A0ABZ0VUE1_9HYPH|nr:hypothetical protein [Mesorhizobium huakuii]WQC01120.1 hypothetical protein U0R22_005334 [Mesorhizobium huakuii]